MKEFTPKLFSENLSSETPELTEQLEDDNTEQLFDQEKNEEEDFEIPAFKEDKNFNDKKKIHENSILIIGNIPFSSDVE